LGGVLKRLPRGALHVGAEEEAREEYGAGEQHDEEK
jgi:hypothetical protein